MSYSTHKMNIMGECHALLAGTRVVAAGSNKEVSHLKELFNAEFEVNKAQLKATDYHHKRIGNHLLPKNHAMHSRNHMVDGVAIYQGERLVKWYEVGHKGSSAYGVGVYTLLAQELSMLRWILSQVPPKKTRKRK